MRRKKRNEKRIGERKKRKEGREATRVYSLNSLALNSHLWIHSSHTLWNSEGIATATLKQLGENTGTIAPFRKHMKVSNITKNTSI